MNLSAPSLRHEEYALINEFLAERFGLTFPEHKREILESRVRPRLAALGLKSYMDYYVLLQYNPNGGGELAQLARVVTNNESYFFRETHQFEALFQHGIEELKEDTALPGSLRFLCAGCSSGEEPYTLNIFSRENQYRMWGQSVAIDAFDLDDHRIAMAERAEYSQGSLRAVTEEQVSRYFTPGPSPGTRSLKSAFKLGVAFKVANILRPETYHQPIAYDALFCRNVLIYFSEPTLRKAIESFASCLRRGGLLFLGHSESIIGMTPLFEPVRLGDCIAYRRVL